MKMKKLSLFLLLSLFAFYGCGDDDFTDTKDGIDNEGSQEGGDENEGKKEAVISFEDLLTEPESEFISTSKETAGYYYIDKFNDPQNYITFDHYFSDWGQGYSFGGFTYTNKTTHIQDCQPNCGNVKTGKVYIGVFSDEFTPASLKITNTLYSIKGLWITNSKNAYVGMTEGDSYAKAFKKGDWYKVTATGYNDEGDKIAETSINPADYKSDEDKPVNTWIWFDLTPLKDASTITLFPSSSDSGEFGMNTGKYFCIDDLTLIEK